MINFDNEYYLDGNAILAEKITSYSNAVKNLFYYDQAEIYGFNYNGSDYYFAKSLQGDIIRVYNSSGTVVGSYSYDAWGVCTIGTDVNGIATLNPWRYRGYYYDQETGLYYLNSRYYDPVVGRFINADGVGYLNPLYANGLNLYAYCGNNPVMYYDPNGNEKKWWETALLYMLVPGYALGAMVGGIVSLATGGDLREGVEIGGEIGTIIAVTGIAALLAVAAAPIVGGVAAGGFVIGGSAVLATSAVSVLTVVGVGAAVLGLGVMFSLSGKGPKDTRRNTVQNEEFDRFAKEKGLGKKTRRMFHDYISKKGRRLDDAWRDFMKKYPTINWRNSIQII